MSSTTTYGSHRHAETFKGVGLDIASQAVRESESAVNRSDDVLRAALALSDEAIAQLGLNAAHPVLQKLSLHQRAATETESGGKSKNERGSVGPQRRRVPLSGESFRRSVDGWLRMLGRDRDTERRSLIATSFVEQDLARMLSGVREVPFVPAADFSSTADERFYLELLTSAGAHRKFKSLKPMGPLLANLVGYGGALLAATVVTGGLGAAGLVSTSALSAIASCLLDVKALTLVFKAGAVMSNYHRNPSGSIRTTMKRLLVECGTLAANYGVEGGVQVLLFATLGLDVSAPSIGWALVHAIVVEGVGLVKPRVVELLFTKDELAIEAAVAEHVAMEVYDEEMAKRRANNFEDLPPLLNVRKVVNRTALADGRLAAVAAFLNREKANVLRVWISCGVLATTVVAGGNDLLGFYGSAVTPAVLRMLFWPSLWRLLGEVYASEWMARTKAGIGNALYNKMSAKQRHVVDRVLQQTLAINIMTSLMTVAAAVGQSYVQQAVDADGLCARLRERYSRSDLTEDETAQLGRETLARALGEGRDVAERFALRAGAGSPAYLSALYLKLGRDAAVLDQIDRAAQESDFFENAARLAPVWDGLGPDDRCDLLRTRFPALARGAFVSASKIGGVTFGELQRKLGVSELGYYARRLYLADRREVSARVRLAHSVDAQTASAHLDALDVLVRQRLLSPDQFAGMAEPLPPSLVEQALEFKDRELELADARKYEEQLRTLDLGASNRAIYEASPKDYMRVLFDFFSMEGFVRRDSAVQEDRQPTSPWSWVKASAMSWGQTAADQSGFMRWDSPSPRFVGSYRSAVERVHELYDSQIHRIRATHHAEREALSAGVSRYFMALGGGRGGGGGGGPGLPTAQDLATTPYTPSVGESLSAPTRTGEAAAAASSPRRVPGPGLTSASAYRRTLETARATPGLSESVDGAVEADAARAIDAQAATNRDVEAATRDLERTFRTEGGGLTHEVTGAVFRNSLALSIQMGHGLADRVATAVTAVLLSPLALRADFAIVSVVEALKAGIASATGPRGAEPLLARVTRPESAVRPVKREVPKVSECLVDPAQLGTAFSPQTGEHVLVNRETGKPLPSRCYFEGSLLSAVLGSTVRTALDAIYGLKRPKTSAALLLAGDRIHANMRAVVEQLERGQGNCGGPAAALTDQCLVARVLRMLDCTVFKPSGEAGSAGCAAFQTYTLYADAETAAFAGKTGAGLFKLATGIFNSCAGFVSAGLEIDRAVAAPLTGDSATERLRRSSAKTAESAAKMSATVAGVVETVRSISAGELLGAVAGSAVSGGTRETMEHVLSLDRDRFRSVFVGAIEGVARSGVEDGLRLFDAVFPGYAVSSAPTNDTKAGAADGEDVEEETEEKVRQPGSSERPQTPPQPLETESWLDARTREDWFTRYYASHRPPTEDARLKEVMERHVPGFMRAAGVAERIYKYLLGGVVRT